MFHDKALFRFVEWNITNCNGTILGGFSFLGYAIFPLMKRVLERACIVYQISFNYIQFWACIVYQIGPIIYNLGNTYFRHRHLKHPHRLLTQWGKISDSVKTFEIQFRFLFDLAWRVSRTNSWSQSMWSSEITVFKSQTSLKWWWRLEPSHHTSWHIGKPNWDSTQWFQFPSCFERSSCKHDWSDGRGLTIT